MCIYVCQLYVHIFVSVRSFKGQKVKGQIMIFSLFSAKMELFWAINHQILQLYPLFYTQMCKYAGNLYVHICVPERSFKGQKVKGQIMIFFHIFIKN